MWTWIVHKLTLFAVSDWANQIPTDGDTFTQAKYPKVVQFYDTWQQYMHHHFGIITDTFGWLQTELVKGFYNLCLAVEKVFNAMFSLLGWSSDSIATGVFKPLYQLISTVGWALLALSIIVLVWMSLGHAVSWGKALPNIIMVTLTITVLPLFMQQVSKIAQAAEQDVSAVNLDGSKTVASLSLQPIENNIIDLGYVAKNGWKSNPEKADSSSNPLNTLNKDQKVDGLDLTDAMSKPMIKLMLKESNETTGTGGSWDAKNWPGTPFLYEMTSNVNGTGNYMLNKLDISSAGLGKANDDMYARYTVHWLQLIGQYMILIAVLVFAAFRVTKDIFELTAMNLIAPIMAYQSVQSGKKLRDLIMSIVGLYTSIVLMMVVVKMYMVFVAVAPTLKAFSSLSTTEQGLATCIIYAAGGVAMFSGISYFERVTGVTQGFGQTAGQVGAMAAAGGMVGGVGASLAGKALGATESGIGRMGRAISNRLSSSGATNLNHSSGGPGGVSLTGGGSQPGGPGGSGPSGKNGTAGGVKSGADGTGGAKGVAGEGGTGGQAGESKAGQEGTEDHGGTNGNGQDGQVGQGVDDTCEPTDTVEGASGVADTGEGTGVDDLQTDTGESSGIDQGSDDTGYDGSYDGSGVSIDDGVPNDTTSGVSEGSYDPNADDPDYSGHDSNAGTGGVETNNGEGHESTVTNPNGVHVDGVPSSGSQPSVDTENVGFSTGGVDPDRVVTSVENQPNPTPNPAPTFRERTKHVAKKAGSYTVRKTKEVVTNAPTHIENGGKRTFDLSKQYLQGRGMNIGQGNTHGVESSHFGEE